jgi:hypothetical protein
MEVIKDRIAGGDVEMKEVWESQWRFYKHWKPSFKVGKYVVNWNYMEKFVPEELKGY